LKIEIPMKFNSSMQIPLFNFFYFNCGFLAIEPRRNPTSKSQPPCAHIPPMQGLHHHQPSATCSLAAWRRLTFCVTVFLFCVIFAVLAFDSSEAPRVTSLKYYAFIGRINSGCISSVGRSENSLFNAARGLHVRRETSAALGCLRHAPPTPAKIANISNAPRRRRVFMIMISMRRLSVKERGAAGAVVSRHWTALG
jgi:hypothetical protein